MATASRDERPTWLRVLLLHPLLLYGREKQHQAANPHFRAHFIHPANPHGSENGIVWISVTALFLL